MPSFKTKRKQVYNYFFITLLAFKSGLFMASKIFGIITNSHSNKNLSLSKLGSILQISVKASDNSVLENTPLKTSLTYQEELKGIKLLPNDII